MTVALIALIVFLFLCFFSWARKSKQAKDWKKRNRGSRTIEQAERKKWSEQLFREYCDLIGRELPYPTLERTKHWCDFTGSEYQNRRALEILRARHGLPSDDELKGTSFDRSFKNETNYVNLQKIIWFCVFRAVTQRGYRLNGIDFDELRKNRLKNDQCRKDHPWMSDDYHRKK